MNQNEAIDVLKICLPIYCNLHDKVKHNLSSDEIKSLNNFKLIWENQLFFEDGIIEQAGLDLYKVAFLGGWLMRPEIQARQPGLTCRNS